MRQNRRSLHRRVRTARRSLPALLLLLLAALLGPPGGRAELPPIEGEEKAQLVLAPNVPPPIDRDYAAKVIVEMEVLEETRQIADGVEYTFWGFGNDVPGPFVRLREGDLVEFTLHNHPDSSVPHNIDLHAVTGPGGGAEASFTAPGHSSTFSFRALNPGIFVYHCATAPVGMHIANGMYGLILVEPAAGLPPVDREYYVMQGDFYTEGEYGEEGLQPFSMDKAIDEDADYVLFNGRVGALVGERALTAKQGEKIRLFVGNGGPNLVSSFHVIGEIFDTLYPEGSTVPIENVQTTLIPAGGAAIAEFSVEVPGTYILVDHSIFRAFNKGAIGMIEVGGEENLAVYSGKTAEEIYQPEGQSVVRRPRREAPKAAEEAEDGDAPFDLSASIEDGKRVYQSSCMACHLANGKGMPGVFPPLANSDYLMADPERAVRIVLEGLSGPVVVNGERYEAVMPPQGLTDAKTADVLNFVMNSWGNEQEKPITKEQVAAIRDAIE